VRSVDGGQRLDEIARAADRANFEAGYEVVREYGRLSETGRAVMNEAVAYMKRLLSGIGYAFV
jgi:hypothetical protein